MNVLVGRGYNPTLCLEGGGKEGYLPHIHLFRIFPIANYLFHTHIHPLVNQSVYNLICILSVDSVSLCGFIVF